jgi:hypothetical protein
LYGCNTGCHDLLIIKINDIIICIIIIITLKIIITMLNTIIMLITVAIINCLQTYCVHASGLAQYWRRRQVLCLAVLRLIDELVQHEFISACTAWPRAGLARMCC